MGERKMRTFSTQKFKKTNKLEDGKKRLAPKAIQLVLHIFETLVRLNNNNNNLFDHLSLAAFKKMKKTVREETGIWHYLILLVFVVFWRNPSQEKRFLRGKNTLTIDLYREKKIESSENV